MSCSVNEANLEVIFLLLHRRQTTQRARTWHDYPYKSCTAVIHDMFTHDQRGYNAIKNTLFKWNENLLLGRVNAGRDMCFGKLHLLIQVKNMTHVTELELNTRAFAPPFVRIPFIPVVRTKECEECAHILLQVGSSDVRFKKVPLTTESKISLRSRSCSPAINRPFQLVHFVFPFQTTWCYSRE